MQNRLPRSHLYPAPPTTAPSKRKSGKNSAVEVWEESGRASRPHKGRKSPLCRRSSVEREEESDKDHTAKNEAFVRCPWEMCDSWGEYCWPGANRSDIDANFLERQTFQGYPWLSVLGKEAAKQVPG